MKILNFKEFCSLPEGTLFSYYQPCICEGLCRKGETISWDGEPHDFYMAELVPACWNGEHPTIDKTECRWGVFDEEQLFAVLEPKDVQTVREMIGDTK